MNTIQGYFSRTTQPFETNSAVLQTPDPYVAADADEEGRIYAVGNRSNNKIVRIDPDGSVAWTSTAELDVDIGESGVFSISKSTVGSEGTDDPGPRSREITRHDFSTGIPNWRFETKNVGGDILKVAVGKDFVYGGTITGDVLKVGGVDQAEEPETPIWIFSEISSAVRAIDTDSQGSVYVGFEDDTIRKINNSPSAEWLFSGHSDDITGVVASSNNVYSSSRDGTVKNISGGSEVWSFEVGSPATSLDLASDGSIYVCAERNGSSSPAIIKLNNEGSEDSRLTTSKPVFDIGVSENIAIPFNLKFESFDVSKDEVSISWNVFELNPATEYNVYRSVDGGNSFEASVVQVSEKTANDNTNSVGKSSNVEEILYKVTSLRNGRESDFSNAISVSYENFVRLDSALISSEQLQVSWSVPQDPNGKVDSFEVLESDSFFGPYVPIESTSSQSFSKSTSKKILYYKIRALDADENVLKTSDVKSANNTITETFESYDLEETVADIESPVNFVGGQKWFIDNEHSRVGKQSLRSEDIDNSEFTEISIKETPSDRKQIYINWGVDSESIFDTSELFKNGTTQKTLSGENVDSQEIFSVPAGTETEISQNFVKDFSISEFGDAAWIHEIIIANVIKPKATVSVSGSSVTVEHKPRGTDVDGDFSGFNVYVDQNKVTQTPKERGSTFVTSPLSSGEHTVSITNVRSDGVDSFRNFYKVSI